MVSARALSESVVFYYGGAMTVGIILVFLMILFQVNTLHYLSIVLSKKKFSFNCGSGD